MLWTRSFSACRNTEWTQFALSTACYLVAWRFVRSVPWLILMYKSDLKDHRASPSYEAAAKAIMPEEGKQTVRAQSR